MNKLWKQINMGLSPGSTISCVDAVNMSLKFATPQLLNYWNEDNNMLQ